MTPLFDIQLLIDAIKTNKVILTPNQRLAHQIHLAYEQHQRQHGYHSWPTPEIYPLHSWLHQLWLTNTKGIVDTASTILPHLVEHYIWQTIVSKNKTPCGVEDIMQAYNLLRLWQIDLNHPDIAQSQYPSVQLFYQCANEFLAFCHHHQTMTLADALLELSKHNDFFRHTNQSINGIVLVAFDDISPLYKHILGQIDPQLTKLQPHLHNQPKHLRRTEIESALMEYRCAAQFTKNILEVDNQATIGIIVPNLNQQRHIVERCFRDALQPDYKYPHSQPLDKPFNISAGISLSDTPLISSIVDKLMFLQPTINTQTLLRWVHTPYSFCAQTPLTQLDAFIKAILKLHQKELPTAKVLQLAKEHFPKLAQALTQIEHIKRSIPKQQSIEQWLKLFEKILHLLEFPGPRGLNSAEYQQLQHYLTTLGELGDLMMLDVSLDLNQAVNTLNLFIQKHTFQTQSDESPVHILGVLEAAGLCFDHIWVVHFSDSQWPTPANPNPYLPFNIQKKYQLPRADRTREWHYNQTLTVRLERGARQTTTISYSPLEADIPVSASPLIQSIGFMNIDQLVTVNHPYEKDKINPLYTLEHYLDDFGVPITQKKVSGGSRILADQAQCPFKAYAIHRLHANPYPQEELGLNPMERGVYLHQALEQLSYHINNSHTLNALSSNQVSQLITQCIADTLNDAQEKWYQCFPDTLWKIEKTRLEQLLNAFLIMEKKRPSFNIFALEKTMSVELAELSLKLRIDRIDQTDDNRYIIIDYKTGATQLTSWQGVRPEQPQLPLYALYLEEKNVDALLFIEINQQGINYRGLSDGDILPGVTAIEKLSKRYQLPNQWHGLFQHWQQVLHHLADEFSKAHALVNPKSKTICRHCHLSALCRIKERSEIY